MLVTHRLADAIQRIGEAGTRRVGDPPTDRDRSESAPATFV
jgi:hypothetical protein